MPLVTVAMTVYNGMPYLPRSIESVLAQTFTDFSLLIINDGSTDRTTDILHRYARRDPRIRLIERENRGLVPSLTQALELADSPLIARIDHDDLCMPWRLAEQVAYLNAHPECVLVGGYFELIDAGGRKLYTVRPPTEHADIDRCHLAGHTSIPQPVAAFRSAAARAVGGYSLAHETAEDLDLWLRLAEVGTLHNIPRVLIQYRQHDRSMSSTRAAAQLTAMRRGCEDAWKRRNIQGTFQVTEHWRPGADRASRLKYTLSVGWSAFAEGHRATAIVYGAKAIRIAPASAAAWKLLACAATRPLPRSHTTPENPSAAHP